MTFSRIPVLYFKFKIDDRDLSKTMSFFPLVGCLVAAIVSIYIFLFGTFLPKNILVITSIFLLVVLTGAFHEDGFADTCDSYGVYSRQKMLEVMRDSRIGTFGALGLIFLILIRFSALSELNVSDMPPALILSMTLGRFLLMPVFYALPYIGVGGGVNQTNKILSFGLTEMFFAFFTAFVVGMLILKSFYLVALFVVVGQVLIFCFGLYFYKRIGGLTGDIGGALEQIGEVLALIFFVLLKNGTLSI